MKIPKNPYVPSDMPSDGCTMCGLCRKLLGAERYESFCREHDFLRRYDVIHWFKSNYILAYRVFGHGLIGKLRAPLYLIGTTITYPWYRETKKLPKEWEQHANHYRD